MYTPGLWLKTEAVVKTVFLNDHGTTSHEDTVAAEAPLEIHIDGVPSYLVMRSPGREKELALGYCFSEGFIDSLQDVDALAFCEDEDGNRVDVILNAERKAAKGLIARQRRLPVYSSCGLCGKQMIEDICAQVTPRKDTLSVESSDVQAMLRALEQCQKVFEETGGTHAAALFDRGFELLAVAEDIGRHNALDKATGQTILESNLGRVMVAVLTSRLSFEMVQKIGRTGAEILIGMSSPTSLGIELAEKINLTVVGFATQSRFNVYSGFHRIALGGQEFAAC
jgi:FdhD protein